VWRKQSRGLIRRTSGGCVPEASRIWRIQPADRSGFPVDKIPGTGAAGSGWQQSPTPEDPLLPYIGGTLVPSPDMGVPLSAIFRTIEQFIHRRMGLSTRICELSTVMGRRQGLRDLPAIPIYGIQPVRAGQVFEQEVHFVHELIQFGQAGGQTF